MITVGLTGGIATGKSLVSKFFKELGAHIIDYDKVSRIVVEPGLPAWQDIVNYFGDEILQKDQKLDREKLGLIVFSDEEKRRRLELFIYPHLRNEVKKQHRAAVESDSNTLIIHDVPLLLEAGGDKWVDKTIAVFACEETQIKRLKERDGMSEENAKNRINAQMPMSEKLQRVDYVIYNDGPLDETKKQVERLYVILKEIKKKIPSRY